MSAIEHACEEAAAFVDEPLATACCNVLLLMYADAAPKQPTRSRAVSLLHAMSEYVPVVPAPPSPAL